MMMSINQPTFTQSWITQRLTLNRFLSKYGDDDGDNLTNGSSTVQTTENDQPIQPSKLAYTFTQPSKQNSSCNQTNNNHSLIIFRCRICLEEEGDDPDGLMSPCRCKGTVGLVHRNCLEKWLLTSGKPSCELCGYAYIMTPSKRRSSQFSTLNHHHHHPFRRFNYL
ncbi:unnamed protein product [Trichobilharzia regenti]|nr:unnamed protein product [Trichobilharzia regenti]